MSFTLKTESTTKTVVTDRKIVESSVEIGRTFMIVWINFTRKTNPVDCHFCGLKFYWEKNCPDSIIKKKYDIWLYEQEHVAFLEIPLNP